MNCICCGAEGEFVRENSSHVYESKEEFGLVIPHVEIWVCKECNMGWAYQDEVLSMMGRAWISMESAKIPIGALAVWGDEPA
jgi:hypothetical protein